MNTLTMPMQNAIKEFEVLLSPEAIDYAYSLTPDAFAPLYAGHIHAAQQNIVVPGSAIHSEFLYRGIANESSMAHIFTAVFYAAMYQRRPDAHKTKPLREYLDALIAEK